MFVRLLVIAAVVFFLLVLVIVSALCTAGSDAIEKFNVGDDMGVK